MIAYTDADASLVCGRPLASACVTCHTQIRHMCLAPHKGTGSMTATARTSAVPKLALRKLRASFQLCITFKTNTGLPGMYAVGRDGYTTQPCNSRRKSALVRGTKGRLPQQPAGDVRPQQQLQPVAAHPGRPQPVPASAAHLLLPAAMAAGLPAGNQSTLL